MAVELSPASRDEEPIVENLMELYLFEFSAVSQRDVMADGRFGYQPLALYWLDPGRYPFLIRVDGKLAGFALVLDAPEEGPIEPGRGMAEFFVLPKYRRRGVGRSAAVALFRMFPGRWWVAEHIDNQPAQAFWRAVIGSYTGGAYEEEIRESDGERMVVHTFDA